MPVVCLALPLLRSHCKTFISFNDAEGRKLIQIYVLAFISMIFSAFLTQNGYYEYFTDLYSFGR